MRLLECVNTAFDWEVKWGFEKATVSNSHLGPVRKKHDHLNIPFKGKPDSVILIVMEKTASCNGN